MQGQLARSEGRDEMKTSKPFGFDRFSVSDSKLSPSACLFLFFWDLWEVQMPMKVRKRYVTSLFAMGPIFSSSFLMGCETFLRFFFCKRRSKLSAKRPESWWKFLWFPQAAPSTKVTETFFLWGKKLRWKRWCEGENWKLCSRTLVFFGKETLTTAFVPSFYLNLAWRNWYFVVNL